jgi:hypothetical protein
MEKTGIQIHNDLDKNQSRKSLIDIISDSVQLEKDRKQDNPSTP